MLFKKILKLKHFSTAYVYNPPYDVCELNGILSGKNPGNAWFNRNYFLRRMFERLSWFELFEILGVKEIVSVLTDQFIAGMKDVGLRKKYELIRQFLQGQTISLRAYLSAATCAMVSIAMAENAAP